MVKVAAESKMSSSDEAVIAIKKKAMLRCRPSDPFDLSAYRDKPGLVGIVALVVFLIAITVTTVVTDEKPPLYNCRSNSMKGNCRKIEERNGANITVVHYSFNPRRQKGQEGQLCNQFNSNGVPFPTVNETEDTDDITFVLPADNKPPGFDLRKTPKGEFLVTCTRSKALYHQVVESKALYIYGICSGATYLVSMGFVSLLFVAPIVMLEGTHVLTQLVLWSGLFFSAVTNPFWIIFWLLFLLIHATVYVLCRSYFVDVMLFVRLLRKLVVELPGIVMQSAQASFACCGWFIYWAWLFSLINGRFSIAVDIILYISLFWIFQLIKYHNHTVLSGAIASWYFNRLVDTEYPVLRSFLRATTTSLGSVALGSLFTAICKIFTIIASSLRSVRKGSMQALAAAARIVASVFSIFNVYGFVHNAVYGTSFLEGCRMSRQSINEASLQLIMVDGTVSTTNIIAGIFVGFASSGLAYILRDTMYPNELTATSNWVVLFVPCWLLGFFTGLSNMDMLESTCVTIYTCFADEPFALQNVDPDIFQELTDTWHDAIEEDADAEHDDDGLFDDDDDESISDFGDEENATADAGADGKAKMLKNMGKSTKFMARLEQSADEEDVVVGIPVPPVAQ